MADRTRRGPANVPGSYYVDDSCIDCDVCRSNAPRFFAREPIEGISFVHRQPVIPEEIAEAELARNGCPTDSIGNDG